MALLPIVERGDCFRGKITTAATASLVLVVIVATTTLMQSWPSIEPQLWRFEKGQIAQPEPQQQQQQQQLQGPPWYSHTRNDRTGMVITGMLDAYAYSRQQGHIYGGSCRNGRATSEAQARELLLALGLNSTLPLLPQCPPNATILHDRPFRGMRPLFTAEFSEHVQVLMQVSNDKDELRSSTNQTTTTKHTKYVVAIHVRRGDVRPSCEPNKPNHRYLPNSHYLQLLGLYLPPSKRLKKDHIVYVFSERSSYEPWTMFTQSRYNVSLQLDTNIAHTWMTMITADLLLTSRSSFSLIPAMLNANGTIVYTPQHLMPPLPHYKVVSMKLTKASDRAQHKLCKK